MNVFDHQREQEAEAIERFDTRKQKLYTPKLKRPVPVKFKGRRFTRPVAQSVATGNNKGNSND